MIFLKFYDFWCRIKLKLNILDLNDGDNEIYWYMHKSKDCTFEMIDSKSFYLTKNGKRIKVMFLTNANSVSVYETDARHLVREAPDEQEEITQYNKLAIKLNASKRLRWIV